MILSRAVFTNFARQYNVVQSVVRVSLVKYNTFQ